jgi:succinate dehydrogenase/fumarate reductase-like Fe-S protein
MQDLQVELRSTGRMLLDALMRIKSGRPTTVVSSLLPRRRVRLGRDEHQRQERSGLHHELRDLKEPIVLKPLPGLPVIRDLIVDMTQFFKQYHSIKPYLINDTPPPEKERLQSPEPSARSSTACTSASCAPAARRPARRSGGTPTSSSARPACCRPTGSSPTAVTRPPARGSTISRIPTGCSAATRS